MSVYIKYNNKYKVNKKQIKKLVTKSKETITKKMQRETSKASNNKNIKENGFKNQEKKKEEK